MTDPDRSYVDLNKYLLGGIVGGLLLEAVFGLLVPSIGVGLGTSIGLGVGVIVGCGVFAVRRPSK